MLRASSRLSSEVREPVKVRVSSAKRPALAGVRGSATEGESSAEELARRHVEELLEADPERVGALLSRWALGEDYYQQKVKA